jgi:hypothetical protein
MVEGSVALELEGSRLEGIGGERPEKIQELRASTAKCPRERGEGHA